MRIFPKMILDSCEDCPYLEWVYNSNGLDGYKCKKVWRMVITDWDWYNSRNSKRLNKKHDKIPIPDWCPLEKDVEENGR